MAVKTSAGTTVAPASSADITSLGSGESFSIDIIINSSGNVSYLEKVIEEVEQLGKSKEKEADTFKKNKDAVDSNAESLRKTISPIRSVSWDLILMGRSLSILNTTFFGTNETLKTITGLVYGAGAALRIFVTAIDFVRIAQQMGLITSAATVVANKAETASLWGLVQAKVAQLSLMGPVGWGLLMVGGAIAGAAVASYMGMMKGGGIIPQTGMYLMHKDETVIPAGASISTININMTSGPISSSVDVDNMLDHMARRMVLESRRRGAG